MLDSISFCTAPGSMRLDIGYGVAGYNIVTSLQKLGLAVPYNDRDAKVQLNFCQAEWATKRSNQYSILYTPWESTVLPESWPDTIKEHDEFWTTSPICKEWFENAGVKVSKVYQHGIEKEWTPKFRKRGDRLKFLHVGEPAPRKNGQLTFDAFRAAFGDQKDVELTIKAFAHSTIRTTGPAGFGGIKDVFDNVKLDTRIIPKEKMPQYFHEFDVMIYPSAGEGFGLIPLQAIATGMPSVVTSWWCPYSKFILPLDYEIINSPWLMHHGKVAKPDFDQLVWYYKDIYQNFEYYSFTAYEKSSDVHSEYDWLNLTDKAFKDVIERF